MDYTQITDEQRDVMLGTIGVASVEELFASLPVEYRLEGGLAVPEGASELELQRELGRLAGKNRSAGKSVCFMGAGAYDHFIPSTVGDVGKRGEFLTAYTPYQAEASQGSLQVFFEFQTQVSRLTGMDIANASLYEGASAVTEAVFMAINVTGKRRVLVAETLHPHYLAVLRTSCAALPVELVVLKAEEGKGVVSAESVKGAMDHDTAAVVVQSPNVYGMIEDWEGQFEAGHSEGKTLGVAVFNPIACALLKNPGVCGADIAVGEGQPLGVPLQAGGPWLGLFAAKEKLLRKMPGRLIGQTTDADGRRGFCLTLQTREQHIRGAKATSNICTNQGLLAVYASVYMTTMGPKGMREAARQCYHKAHYAAERIGGLEGHSLAYDDGAFFHEFVVNCPADAEVVVKAGHERGISPGIAMKKVLGIGENNQLLIAVTEKRSVDEIDALVDLLGEVT